VDDTVVAVYHDERCALEAVFGDGRLDDRVDGAKSYWRATAVAGTVVAASAVVVAAVVAGASVVAGATVDPLPVGSELGTGLVSRLTVASSMASSASVEHAARTTAPAIAAASSDRRGAAARAVRRQTVMGRRYRIP
jgi:hypothetical protein